MEARENAFDRRIAFYGRRKRKNERFVPFDGISNYPMKGIPADRIVELWNENLEFVKFTCCDLDLVLSLIELWIEFLFFVSSSSLRKKE